MKLIKMMQVPRMRCSLYKDKESNFEIGIYELEDEELDTCRKKHPSAKYMLANSKLFDPRVDANRINDFFNAFMGERHRYQGFFETQLEAELYFKCSLLEEQIIAMKMLMKPCCSVKDM